METHRIRDQPSAMIEEATKVNRVHGLHRSKEASMVPVSGSTSSAPASVADELSFEVRATCPAKGKVAKAL